MNELNAADSIAGHIAFSFSDLQVIVPGPQAAVGIGLGLGTGIADLNLT